MNLGAMSFSFLRPPCLDLSPRNPIIHIVFSSLMGALIKFFIGVWPCYGKLEEAGLIIQTLLFHNRSEVSLYFKACSPPCVSIGASVDAPFIA